MKEKNTMTTQLINFNMPDHLKTDLDMLAKRKNISRTAIILNLLEDYCRKEWKQISERDGQRAAERVAQHTSTSKEIEHQDIDPPAPIFGAGSSWEDSYLFEHDD